RAMALAMAGSRAASASNASCRISAERVRIVPRLISPPVADIAGSDRHIGIGRDGLMAKLFVVTRNGEERELTASPGLAVMAILRDGGVDEVLALCGGCCSCATCHVYFDDATLSKLSKMSEDESDLLDSSDHRQPQSRLSCQIPFSDALDGARVTVAP